MGRPKHGGFSIAYKSDQIKKHPKLRQEEPLFLGEDIKQKYGDGRKQRKKEKENE